MQAKLVDESGREVGDDAPGVLWVRHPSLALGYKSSAATARSFRDGWFCTGDLFTRDADGFWSHQGRADELYKIAGQWVKRGGREGAGLGDGGSGEGGGGGVRGGGGGGGGGRGVVGDGAADAAA